MAGQTEHSADVSTDSTDTISTRLSGSESSVVSMEMVDVHLGDPVYPPNMQYPAVPNVGQDPASPVGSPTQESKLMLQYPFQSETKTKTGKQKEMDSASSHSASSNSSTGNQCYCNIVCGAIIIIILAGFILGLLYIKYTETPSSRQPFCFPCQDVILSSEPIDDYSGVFNKKGPADETCCLEDGNTAQLNAYITAKTEAQIRQGSQNGVPVIHNAALSWDLEAPPPRAMAQLFVNEPVTNVKNSTGETQTIREYSAKGNKAYIYDGIQYDQMRGRFIIRIPGEYEVVSHVGFVKPDENEDGANLVFIHEIKRETRRKGGRGEAERRRGGTVLAREIQERTCERDTSSIAGVLCYSSTLPASFKLRFGDEVFVQVSHKELLAVDGSATFIGIRRIESHSDGTSHAGQHVESISNVEREP